MTNLDRDYQDYLVTTASDHLQREDWAACLAAAQSAAEIDADPELTASAHDHCSIAHFYLGNEAQMRASLARALAIHPHDQRLWANAALMTGTVQLPYPVACTPVGSWACEFKTPK